MAPAMMVCPQCSGEGEVFSNPGYPDPQSETSMTCPACNGTGLRHRAQVADDEHKQRRARRMAAKERFKDSGLTAAELVERHRQLREDFYRRESARRAA